MEKKVGVVMVNYKDYAVRFLAEAAASWRTQSYPSALSHLYIVDNASSAQSQASIGQLCPEARIIARSDGNYCAANNAGAQAALADGCEYLVFANMDTVFAPDWLKCLVEALADDKNIGVAQSKIFLYPPKSNGEEIVNSLGNLVHFLGFGFARGNGRLASDYKDILGYPDITYASGCSFIIRAEVFSKIGGYNEHYYMYHDDLEISYKAKLAGYRVVLAPKSVLWHKYEFSRSVNMLYYMERNRHIFFFSFYPFFARCLLFLPLLIMDFGVALFALKNGWSKGLGQIIGYFFRPQSWREIHEQRSYFKHLASRKRRRQIMSMAVGAIDFQEINNPLLRLVNPIFSLYWRLIKKLI